MIALILSGADPLFWRTICLRKTHCQHATTPVQLVSVICRWITPSLSQPGGGSQGEAYKGLTRKPQATQAPKGCVSMSVAAQRRADRLLHRAVSMVIESVQIARQRA